ncbi:MAG: hypothetical protein AVO34_12590 [Firmicutes bacterium ML8_F2]|nr:MAG: hypothetical protein AVO34_12590 [Firmicutes bacterium ML8_F2]
MLYQYMAAYFDIAYPTNFHTKLYGSMFLSEHFSKLLMRGSQATFESDHGKVRGITSPSEFAPFWYQYFPKGGMILNNKEWEVCRTKLSSQLRVMKMINKRPLLFKNVYNSLRITQLEAADDNSVFIVIRRELKNNIRSILRGRKRKSGGYQQWRSVMPPSLRFNVPESPVEQALEQICGVYEEIELADKFTNSLFINVTYEDLCRNPQLVMDNIYTQINKNVGTINKRTMKSKLPREFSISQSPLPNDLEQELSFLIDNNPK